MSALPPSLEGAVAEATILVHEINDLDIAAAEPMWRLADLTAEVTHEKGRPSKNSERLTIFDWAEQIGWTEENGRSTSTLSDILKIARNWPEEHRVEGASIWQHREMLSHFDGNVEAASAWLAENAEKEKEERASVRDVTRSGVMGTGPIFNVIRDLIRARRIVMRVPAKLAKADALGTEPNFGQLREEINRLKRGLAYLDRYLADETTIDMDEIQAGLDKILKEAS